MLNIYNPFDDRTENEKELDRERDNTPDEYYRDPEEDDDRD